MQQEAIKIGILSLQGGFEAHYKMIQKLGHQAIYVRYADQLHDCDGLIIPGGESTTISLQAGKLGLIEPIVSFAKRSPIFGTCAGLIWMTYLGLFSISIKRNAYGSQIDSFIEPLQFQGKNVEAVFIRAPKIEQVYQGVDILSYHNNDPILISQGLHLGATFHPELTQGTAIHQFFCERVQSSLLLK